MYNDIIIVERHFRPFSQFRGFSGCGAHQSDGMPTTACAVGEFVDDGARFSECDGDSARGDSIVNTDGESGTGTVCVVISGSCACKDTPSEPTCIDSSVMSIRRLGGAQRRYVG